MRPRRATSIGGDHYNARDCPAACATWRDLARQAGSVGELPHLAGRAVSWSGFGMMMVAFCVGQVAAKFVDPAFSNGAWPMVVPMLVAGVVLTAIAFLWLPRLPTPKKDPP